MFPRGIPFAKPWIPDPDAVGTKIIATLHGQQLTNGPEVRAFEEAAAELLGVGHVVAVSSATAGMMLAWRALLPHPGRIAMPSFGFAATAHAATWTESTIEFCEIDPDRLTLDPDDVLLRNKDVPIGAVCATHIYGGACNVFELGTVCSNLRAPLLYDGAHALGAQYAGRSVAAFGGATVFSLSPTKVVTAAEGGLVATESADVADCVRIGRNYADAGKLDFRFVGLSARMSELHAIVGAHCLQYLEEAIKRRGELVAIFGHAIQDVPGIAFPEVPPESRTTHKDLAIILDPILSGIDAADLQTALAADGIPSRRYFYPPIHLQPNYYRARRVLPITEAMSTRVLCLPLYTEMDGTDMKFIARVVGAIVTERAR